MSSSIANMLTVIRNGQLSGLKEVNFYSSNMLFGIAKILKEEGYISEFLESEITPFKKNLKIVLKYYENKPVISSIKMVSRPGLRIYSSYEKLPKILGGLGISIISTSKGLLVDHEAKKMCIGGEIICSVE